MNNFRLQLPGPNSKSISVLFKPNCKSYFVSQYWASQNTSLKSLESPNQDLDNTWKLIPKSKPTFQKISSENFEVRKIWSPATFSELIYSHFTGVVSKHPKPFQYYQLAPRGVRVGCIFEFSGSYGPFSAISVVFCGYFWHFSVYFRRFFRLFLTFFFVCFWRFPGYFWRFLWLFFRRFLG